jgi:hypothetical protein
MPIVSSSGAVFGFGRTVRAIVPTITTIAVSSITQTTATSGGTVTADGGAPVTVRGVVWSTSPSPTVALATKTTDGTGTGTFASNITGLSAATTYYVRAYATNSAGTAYGSETSFATSAGGGGSGGASVLLVWDTDNADVSTLVGFLSTNGKSITKTSRAAWTGTNPDPSSFSTVIMLNGTTFGTNLNTAAQTNLMRYVSTQGGKYVSSEWDAYQIGIGFLTNMVDLVLATRTSGGTATRTYTIESGYSSHPIFSNLTSPIALPVTGYNVGPLRSFASQPATQIARDENSNCAVAIRTFGTGKVVYFNHAANYTSGNISNSNVRRMYLNAVNW